jgi:hypothetical protein
MPTEQQMLDLQAELNNIAAAIQTQLNLAATGHTAILNKMETLENLKAGLLNTILNARFELNNKLMYTNEDQRKVALTELKANDVDYQKARDELWTLEEQKKQAESEAEFQRRKFRAAELMMLFYANRNP